jgi:hypothetical protein
LRGEKPPNKIQKNPPKRKSESLKIKVQQKKKKKNGAKMDCFAGH